MSAKPARHLALVELDGQGQIVGRVDSDALKQMEAELAEIKTKFKMAQRDVAAKNLRIANLEADRVHERLHYERYADVARIARYWHRKIHGGNPRINPMAPNRFDAVRGILDQERIVWDDPPEGKKRRRKRSEPAYTLEECKAAIDGAAFDHFVKKRKNGSEQHYHDLELIFRDSSHFEEFRDRCPGGVQPLARAREARNDVGEGFQAAASSAASHHGGSTHGRSWTGELPPTLGGTHARDGRALPLAGLFVRLQLAAGAPSP